MASPRYVILVFLVAALGYSSAQESEDPIVTKLKINIIVCKNENPKCMQTCIFQKMGIINDKGRYIEKKAVDWMKIAVKKGTLDQNQASNITKACNRLNNKIVDGCKRGDEVQECLNKEISKFGVASPASVRTKMNERMKLKRAGVKV
ncbi:uncharacterized protein LOC125239624 [Leguminivora glycinivorella]|uniref:uncharacterized protein LOC125239624 n=1 Tax=Leguminivora glycinivorella TaxID=1035111 RepID=UPI00200BF839|nr:uncharacterized protein LOC125239624 [Leguminivora glycinivorella]